MFELDKFVFENFIKETNENVKIERNPTYTELVNKIKRLQKEAKKCKDKEKKKKLRKEIKSTVVKSLKQPSQINETKPIKTVYTRYADDWLVLVKGPIQYAKNIKNKIAKFIKDELKMKFDPEKTLITHTSNPIHFLGKNIKITVGQLVRPFMYTLIVEEFYTLTRF